MRRALVGIGLVVASFSLGGAAVAQTSDYPGGPAPQVAGVSIERGETEIAGVRTDRISPAVVPSAPSSGRFAVTGSDILQLTALGAGLTVGGAIVVLRSRRRASTSSSS